MAHSGGTSVCFVCFCFMRPSRKTPDTAPRLTGLPPQGRTYNTSASRQCFLSSPQPNRTVEKRSPTTPFRGVVGRRPARRKRIWILQAFGSRRGLVAAVDQGGANPEVTYAEAREGAPRTVNVQMVDNGRSGTWPTQQKG